MTIRTMGMARLFSFKPVEYDAGGPLNENDEQRTRSQTQI